jgi:cephalosporin hydroxylase
MMPSDEVLRFREETTERIRSNAQNPELCAASEAFMRASTRPKYSYNFTWMGRPIIQYPQDIIAMQEIIWRVKPDLVIETGVAHGGSAVFYASLLELLGGDRIVVAIDIEIRPHNREAIESHPMFPRIRLIEGSSTAPETLARVQHLAAGRQSVLVCLDSNHTHDHVLRELQLYSPLVTPGSYLVVFDTIIEDLPADMFPDRPWGPHNNPKTAVHEFLTRSDRFAVDREIEAKLLITVCPNGFLRCVNE